MRAFTFLHRVRNKIRVAGTPTIKIASSAKIVACDISITGTNNQLIIQEDVVVRNTQIEILGDNCTIFIGKNSIIGHGCYLSAKEGKKLSIGNDCMLSRNVKIMTSDGHFIYKKGQVINRGRDVIVGSEVWLADGVTILKGVTIGSNSVAGINAMITKDVPATSIVAGNPARVVQEGIERWDR